MIEFWKFGRNAVNDATTSDLDDRMAALMKSFADDLPARIKALDDSFSLAAVDGNDQLAALQSLQTIAHKLAGSAGTFGFPEVSDAVRAMEMVCMEAVETYPVGIDEHMAALRVAHERLMDA